MFDNSFFSGFNRQISDLRGHVAKLTKAIATKEEEIAHLRTSPPPKEDVLEAIGVVFAARAESARLMIEKSIQGWHRRPLSLADGASIAKMRVINAVEPDRSPTPFTLECALLALIGDQLEAGAHRLVADMDWPTPGPAIAARPALIETAERDLATLNNQLADLREKAAAAGVILGVAP